MLSACGDSELCAVHVKMRVDAGAPVPVPPPSPASVPESALDAEIEALSSRLAALRVERRRIRAALRDPARVVALAKRLHYHDAKTRPDIVGYLDTVLAALPFVVTPGRPPWQLVKRATDMVFSELSPEDQEVYLARARTQLGLPAVVPTV
jgi:hypothetical protein